MIHTPNIEPYTRDSWAHPIRKIASSRGTRLLKCRVLDYYRDWRITAPQTGFNFNQESFKNTVCCKIWVVLLAVRSPCLRHKGGRVDDSRFHANSHSTRFLHGHATSDYWYYRSYLSGSVQALSLWWRSLTPTPDRHGKYSDLAGAWDEKGILL